MLRKSVKSSQQIQPKRLCIQTKNSFLCTNAQVTKALQKFHPPRHLFEPKTHTAMKARKEESRREFNSWVIIDINFNVLLYAALLSYLLYIVNAKAQGHELTINNQNDTHDIQTILCLFLPPNILDEKPLLWVMTLKEMLQDKEIYAEYQNQIHAYIKTQVLPKLNEESFDLFATQIFSSNYQDYALACINELKTRFKNIDKLLKIKQDPQCNFEYSETPLVMAVRRGSPAIVEAIIKAGANLHYKFNQSALSYATRMTRVDMVNLLLRYDMPGEYRANKMDGVYEYCREADLSFTNCTREASRIAIAKLLLQHKRLDPIIPLKKAMFADNELVTIGLAVLDFGKQEPWNEAADIFNKLGDLPADYPVNPAALRQFFQAAVNSGYRFRFHEDFYFIRNAASRNNVEVLKVFFKTLVENNIDHRTAFEFDVYSAHDTLVKHRLKQVYENVSKEVCSDPELRTLLKRGMYK